MGLTELLLGGGGLTALATYFAGREAGKAKFLNAVQDAAKEVMAELRKECVRLTAKCDAMEQKHAKCESDLAEVRSAIASWRGSDPVPPYHIR